MNAQKIVTGVIFLSTTLLLMSCQYLPARKLASNSDAAVEYYETSLRLEQLRDNKKFAELRDKLQGQDTYVSIPTDTSHKSSEIELENKQKQLKEQLIKSAPQSSIPLSESYSYDLNWREHHDEFILHDIKPYILNHQHPIRQMSLSTDGTTQTILQLTNKFFSYDKNEKAKITAPDSLENNQPNLVARLKCDQDVIVHRTLKKINLTMNTTYEFPWYDSGLNAERPYIQLFNQNTSCILIFKKPFESQEYGIKFVPEINQLQEIFNPEYNFELCYLPKTDKLHGIKKYFLNSEFSHTSCPLKVDNYQTLEDSYEGVKAKVRALTGKDLSNEYLERRDPFAPLDFSQAPKLDAILISYLVFRSDFSGNVILQALKYHAERGALIRIAISDVITLGKDREMLLNFQARYPNVKLIFYKYKNRNLGIKDWLNQLHRNNHIKLFLTYSKTDPQHNIAILGGRNIHDGFIFDQPTANYVYPSLVDYRPGGDENWAHWEDFETEFRSTDLVKTLMGQFFAALHADYSSIFTRSYTENLQINNAINLNYFDLKNNEVLMRSFVSFPFKDDMQLERAYVNMFDSAQQQIKISTPYFHLTKNIFDSLNRAANRGVKIQLITRFDLKGDTADLVLSDVNKDASNALYKKIQIYEYVPEGKILHSKLILIDGQFVMMGSVNLNKRSFYHDLENATLIYGHGFNNKIDVLYESYKKDSRLISAKQKTVFWKKLIINLFDKEL